MPKYIAAALAWFLPGLAFAESWPHRYPDNVPLAVDFEVRVDGMAVPVYDANPDGTFQDQPPKIPQVTDPGAVAAFDFTGTVSVSVSVHEPITAIDVRPKRLGIVPVMEGNRATFRLDKPAAFGVEINGRVGRPLMVFANAPDPETPKPDSPGVVMYRGGGLPERDAFSTLVFPPGFHDLGCHLVEGWENKTVYVAAGGWVRGGFLFRKCTNVRVRGHGVIARPSDGGQNPDNALWFALSRNCSAADVTVINRTKGWIIVLANSTGIALRNVKVFSYLGGSDGIDVSGSQDVTLDGCFVCTQDDGVAIKSGKRMSNGRPLKNVTVENGTVWFSGLDVGFELWTDTVEDITVRNMDFIRANPNGTAGNNKNIWRGVLKVNNCDHATVRHILFEDIRVEAPRSNYLMSARIFKSYASQQPYRPGSIDGVTFRDIAVTDADELPPSLFHGFGSENQVRNVTVENVSLNGRPVADAAPFRVGPFAENILLRSGTGEPLELRPSKGKPDTAPETKARRQARARERTRTKDIGTPKWVVPVATDAATGPNLFPGGNLAGGAPFTLPFKPGAPVAFRELPEAWWAQPWNKQLPCELRLGPAPETDESAFSLVNTGDKPALMLYTRKVSPINLPSAGTYAVAFDFLTTGDAKARVTLELNGNTWETTCSSGWKWKREVVGIRSDDEGELILTFLNSGLGPQNALYLKNVTVRKIHQKDNTQP